MKELKVTSKSKKRIIGKVTTDESLSTKIKLKKDVKNRSTRTHKLLNNSCVIISQEKFNSVYLSIRRFLFYIR